MALETMLGALAPVLTRVIGDTSPVGAGGGKGGSPMAPGAVVDARACVTGISSMLESVIALEASTVGASPGEGAAGRRDGGAMPRLEARGLFVCGAMAPAVLASDGWSEVSRAGVVV